jgi:hypothetical protein
MRFRGLQIHNHLNWMNHVDKLISMLSRACYAVRPMFHDSNTDALRSVYLAYFHSIMK